MPQIVNEILTLKTYAESWLMRLENNIGMWYNKRKAYIICLCNKYNVSVTRLRSYDTVSERERDNLPSEGITMGKKAYDNRELSWLKFNYRVMEEAKDTSVPLLERLSFASIFVSNLDEFFMVRVGSLRDACMVNDNDRDSKTKMKPSEQLSAIYKRVSNLYGELDKTIAKIDGDLADLGVKKCAFKDLGKKEAEFVEAYFHYEMLPFLSPLVIDRRHPFPFLNNAEVYAIAKLSSKNSVKLGVVKALSKTPKALFIPASEKNGKIKYMLTDEILLHFMSDVFTSFKIEEKSLLRVTRSADINTEEAGYEYELDFRSHMAELIKKRKRLCPVRLELSRELSELTLGELTARLELSKKQVFVIKSPLDMSYASAIKDKLATRTELFFPKRSPQEPYGINPKESMISQIERRDLLLSYPYESIKPFIRLLDEAASDDSVVSIKITLYRVARDSKVVEALIKAAENGKQVTTLVELRARFDEENNIGWSKALEEAGCSILYGPEHLKVHSKLLLITRRDGSEVKYITQVGTGNYNEKTAGLYTDFCLMTANHEIAEDAAAVFTALSTGKLVEQAKHLLVAPKALQNRICEMCNEQIEISRSGGEGYVAAKMNSLTDKVLIDKLIECSQAGVRVDLVIRGISCLIAGIPNVTENIRIISIVGRYLEHSRIYIFGKDCDKVYISSADFMTRNTTRRVEVACPVYDPDLRRRVVAYFQTQLNDNVKAREQNSDGKYVKVPVGGKEALNSQEFFITEGYERAEKYREEQAAIPQKKDGFWKRLCQSLFGKKSN